MRIVEFVIALALFLVGLWLFGAAFLAPDAWKALTFAGGIVAVGLALALPFHILSSASDSHPDEAFKS